MDIDINNLISHCIANCSKGSWQEIVSITTSISEYINVLINIRKI